MGDSTWVNQEKCRARYVGARIVDPGSLSLYAPGNETGCWACRVVGRASDAVCRSLCLVYESILNLQPEEKIMIHNWHTATVNLLALRLLEH